MEIILLEKVDNLGDLGAVVRVKSGYGRNYLLPQGKALPATKRNKDHFDRQRATFEARQNEILIQAQELSTQVMEVEVTLERAAGSSDKLFGSVTNSDISEYFKQKGVDVPRKAVEMIQPIRTLGEHPVRVKLHPDVAPEITVKVTRAMR